MITFLITDGPNGTHSARLDGDVRTGVDPVRAIARDLVDSGAEDQPWRMARDGRVAMHGPSLHWLAATAISDTDLGLKRIWWGRHPQSEPRPVLEAIVERFKAEARERKARARNLAA